MTAGTWGKVDNYPLSAKVRQVILKGNDIENGRGKG